VVGVNWEFSRTVDPVQEPVTLTDAKLHCRALMDVPDEDPIVRSYVRAAREVGEGYTERGWFTQTWKLTGPGWADEIQLPMAAPLQSVTSVKYYDENGTLQTLATSYYDVDTTSRPGRVCRAADQTWPALQSDRKSWRVEIVYVVGWTTVAAIPESFKVGTMLLTDHLYENRSSVQVGVGIGAVELPLGLTAFFGDRVYWTPPVCW
jgi:uncharacterized phiE125 gp8 family phage protein